MSILSILCKISIIIIKLNKHFQIYASYSWEIDSLHVKNNIDNQIDNLDNIDNFDNIDNIDKLFVKIDNFDK